MHLSRITIENFRNFSKLDVQLAGNVVVVGENRVGKSNLIYALRLIFDPALPDSARQLSMSDYWDGLGAPSSEDVIRIQVEIEDFEDDLAILAILTDFRLDDDPDTVRLTYEFNVADQQVRESRRLFYVGFTRARSELHMVYTKGEPSPFVREVQSRLEEDVEL